MKKLLAILLTLAMAASLAACGGSGGGDKPASGGASSGAAAQQGASGTADGDARSIIYLCWNLGDLSFNDLGWEGSQNAAEKYGGAQMSSNWAKIPPPMKCFCRRFGQRKI